MSIMLEDLISMNKNEETIDFEITYYCQVVPVLLQTLVLQVPLALLGDICPLPLVEVNNDTSILGKILIF
jgi:hypothetical protein